MDLNDRIRDAETYLRICRRDVRVILEIGTPPNAPPLDGPIDRLVSASCTLALLRRKAGRR